MKEGTKAHTLVHTHKHTHWSCEHQGLLWSKKKKKKKKRVCVCVSDRLVSVKCCWLHCMASIRSILAFPPLHNHNDDNDVDEVS